MSVDPARRGSNLDLLRVGAASAVVLSHSMVVVMGDAWWTADPHNIFRQLGDDAVAVFFVISGYLVTQSWHRDPDWKRYLARRSLRLLPALLVTVGVTCIVVGAAASETSLPTYYRSAGTWAYMLNATLFFQVDQLPGVFTHTPANAVNGSLWTLRYEFLCYLTVPFVLALVALVRARTIVLCVWAAITALATVFLTVEPSLVVAGIDPLKLAGGTGTAGWKFEPLVSLLSYFVAGMCVFLWRDRIRFRPRVAAACVPLFIASSQLTQLHALSAVALTYCIMCFGLAARPTATRLVAHGDASYGIYLWGYVVEQVVVFTLGSGATPLLVFAAAMPLTWALGFASWHLVEQRALRHRPAATRGQREQPRLAVEPA